MFALKKRKNALGLNQSPDCYVLGKLVFNQELPFSPSVLAGYAAPHCLALPETKMKGRLIQIL